MKEVADYGLVPTLDEMKIMRERAAIARFVCRTGREPGQADVDRELQSSLFAKSTGQVGQLPVWNRELCSVWLRAKGLDIPAAEKK
jgi:hypothetical protein